MRGTRTTAPSPSGLRTRTVDCERPGCKRRETSVQVSAPHHRRVPSMGAWHPYPLPIAVFPRHGAVAMGIVILGALLIIKCKRVPVQLLIRCVARAEKYLVLLTYLRQLKDVARPEQKMISYQ